MTINVKRKNLIHIIEYRKLLLRQTYIPLDNQSNTFCNVYTTNLSYCKYIPDNFYSVD